MAVFSWLDPSEPGEHEFRTRDTVETLWYNDELGRHITAPTVWHLHLKNKKMAKYGTVSHDNLQAGSSNLLFYQTGVKFFKILYVHSHQAKITIPQLQNDFFSIESLLWVLKVLSNWCQVSIVQYHQSKIVMHLN